MFKKIEAAIKRDYKALVKGRIQFIKNGNSSNKDAGIMRYSTATRWNQYTAGKITRKEAIDYAVKRSINELNKDLNEELQHLEAIANAGRLESVNISVEWHKSRVWGYNPAARVAVVWIDNDGNHRSGVYYGSASGCGYDKRSAAVGEALNKCDAVLNALCRYANPKYNTTTATGNKAICYGLGYAAIPYFEAGVGVSCFREAFNLCGYEWIENTAGELSDFYYISKKGK